MIPVWILQVYRHDWENMLLCTICWRFCTTSYNSSDAQCPVRKMIGRALLCCRASLQGTCKGNCSRISPTLMRFASPQMVCVVQSRSHIVFTLQVDLCTLASIFLCPLFRQYASSWSLKICPAMSIGMTTILREFASAVISDSLSFKMAFFLLKKNPNTRKH